MNPIPLDQPQSLLTFTLLTLIVAELLPCRFQNEFFFRNLYSFATHTFLPTTLSPTLYPVHANFRLCSNLPVAMSWP